MDYVASLDMGSETMVMALAELSAGRIQVTDVEQVDSGGIERGRVKDEKLVKAATRRLLDAFRHEHGMEIDSLRVSLPATWLKRVVVKESLAFSRSRAIAGADLKELEKQCRLALPDDGREPVTLLPLSYTLDGEETCDPLGRSARRVEARYACYLARESEMEATRAWLAGLGVERVEFHAEVEAVGQALAMKRGNLPDCALIDLGANSTKLFVFREGRIVHDVELPLGSETIDRDIHVAFLRPLDSIEHPFDVAHRLKHEHGSAIRVMENNGKIIIPGTKYSMELHALLHVEQCRLEELLEGAIFQVQRGGYYRTLPGGILLTGGGSRVKGVETLVTKLSGHAARRAAVTSVEAPREILETPEYLTALGLLACEGKTRKRPATLFNRLFS
jgi:cell division protein FtsA